MKFWRKPLDHDQVIIPVGDVYVIRDQCKGCQFCVEYCPKDVLAMSPEFNVKGYHPPMVVKPGECVDCHLYALSGVRATIPNTRTCAGCHDEAMTESPVEARLIEYIDADEPIPWQKVYWVPDHVYFSHRRHTVAAEIACTVCHGEVGDRTESLSRALVPISMDDCMHCHYEEGVSNDCILCHR